MDKNPKMCGLAVSNDGKYSYSVGNNKLFYDCCQQPGEFEGINK